tara:strand:+ start:1752 stop:2363 length:612 start_codon:yes stop_codon:yes gene_type:complete
MKRKDRMEALQNWPRHRTKGRSEQVIRAAYGQVASSCAWLYSFATGKEPKSDGPISEYQGRLALDQLVIFALHARRLIENTCTKRGFSGVRLSPIAKSTPLGFQIIRIIDVLIHHKDIEIIRTGLQAEILRKNPSTSEGLIAILADYSPAMSRNFDPLVVVKSDRNEVIGFELREFIEVFQEKILIPILKFCEMKNLYLEEDY